MMKVQLKQQLLTCWWFFQKWLVLVQLMFFWPTWTLEQQKIIKNNDQEVNNITEPMTMCKNFPLPPTKPDPNNPPLQ